MYIVINKTKNKTFYHQGNWNDEIDDMVHDGDDLIVVSLYSNTIKVPVQTGIDDDLEPIYGWDEYKMELLSIIDNDLKNKTLWESLKMKVMQH